MAKILKLTRIYPDIIHNKNQNNEHKKTNQNRQGACPLEKRQNNHINGCLSYVQTDKAIRYHLPVKPHEERENQVRDGAGERYKVRSLLHRKKTTDMSAKKQTAVKWLVQQIFGDHTSQWQKEIEQAKAMERQQVENAVTFGNRQVLYDGTETLGEQYYAETYGKD